jgi:hypothetical protein
VTDQATALRLPTRPPRTHGHPPPLRVWIATAAVFALLFLAAAAFFQFRTPLPRKSDETFFRAQIASLQKQEAQYRAQGQDPLSVVFIGTSRIKNVAIDPRQVAASARAVGIPRPVASTFLAIYWGGFERLEPAVPIIEGARPDVVVMMPELFFEDFGRLARARLGFRYLESKLWKRPYDPFGNSEFHDSTCSGFGFPPETRLSLNDLWVRDGTDLTGPKLARAAARRFASDGILVLVADIPVSAPLSKLRPDFATGDFFKKADLQHHPNIKSAWIGPPLAQANYCDWAHIKPESAGLWQRAFFSRSSSELNRLR